MESTLPTLPVAFMNADHGHALVQLNALRAAIDTEPRDPARVHGLLREFINHNREHFGREESAMQAHGFPPFAMHRGEHERALAWLEEVDRALVAGSSDPAVLPALEREIRTWFFQHIRTMDTVTANWLASHGG